MEVAHSIQQVKVSNIVDICFIVYIVVTMPLIPEPLVDW